MFPSGFPILKWLYFIWRCFAPTSAFCVKAVELSFGWKNVECVVFVGLPKPKRSLKGTCVESLTVCLLRPVGSARILAELLSVLAIVDTVYFNIERLVRLVGAQRAALVVSCAGEVLLGNKRHAGVVLI